MLTRVTSRIACILGGASAIIYGTLKLDKAKGPDDFLFIGFIFIGLFLIVFGFKGEV